LLTLSQTGSLAAFPCTRCEKDDETCYVGNGTVCTRCQVQKKRCDVLKTPEQRMAEAAAEEKKPGVKRGRPVGEQETGVAKRRRLGDLESDTIGTVAVASLQMFGTLGSQYQSLAGWKEDVEDVLRGYRKRLEASEERIRALEAKVKELEEELETDEEEESGGRKVSEHEGPAPEEAEGSGSAAV
jgi:hypothetical protein